MIVATCHSYDVSLEDTEKEVIRKCHHTLTDLLDEMNAFKCQTFEGGYDDCSETFSYEEIMAAADFLMQLLDIREMY